MKTIEQTILKNLLVQEAYARKVLPFLQLEYVQDRNERLLLEEVRDYIQKYNQLPSKTAIELNLQKRTNLKEEDYKAAVDILTTLDTNVDDLQWATDETEKWCKQQALHNAIKTSIEILSDEKHPQGKGAIPKIVSDALSVSFTTSIGHDYLEDSDARYDFYHRTEYRIPFDLRDFNKVTKGGLARKTLTVFMGGTNVGKSLFMCHVAANALKLGHNVLYITLEMAREKIAQRIDANLLDVAVNDLETISKESYDSKIQKLKSRCKTGKLIVEEYPPTSVGTQHFRHLLNELKLKRKFVPDIIFVDYINLAVSSRVKMGQNTTSYTYIKAIAEEFRSLAVEHDLPLVTATQLNRKGYNSDDPGLEDTSESFGLPATADLMFVAITNDLLAQQGKILIKQLKNRDNDSTVDKQFLVGIDRPKMRLFDVAEIDQPTGDLTAPSELYKQVGNNRPMGALWDGPATSQEHDIGSVMDTITAMAKDKEDPKAKFKDWKLDA